MPKPVGSEWQTRQLSVPPPGVKNRSPVRNRLSPRCALPAGRGVPARLKRPVERRPGSATEAGRLLSALRNGLGG